MSEQPHIFLASPHMSDEGYEQQYIRQAFEKNFIAPLGENVNLLEKSVASFVGAPATVALNSGSSAIHLGLLAAGVGKGDVVLCQALTFSASANPILYVGASPVFIDSEYETWNMSPEALERAFEKYDGVSLPKPKAVVSVNLYGMASQIERICEICNRYGVPLIEDSAEALGTTIGGKYAGTFGAMGVYSFNGNKIITTSGGGMLVFNQPINGRSPAEAAEKVKFWSTQSKEP